MRYLDLILASLACLLAVMILAWSCSAENELAATCMWRCKGAGFVRCQKAKTWCSDGSIVHGTSEDP
jgi:hypothetical protein